MKKIYRIKFLNYYTISDIIINDIEYIKNKNSCKYLHRDFIRESNNNINLILELYLIITKKHDAFSFSSFIIDVKSDKEEILNILKLMNSTDITVAKMGVTMLLNIKYEK